MKFLVALILAAALSVGTPLAASAQTPSAYRAKLNAVCRSYTPHFKAEGKKMARAVKRKDYERAGYFLGRIILLSLAQDSILETIPVPAAMRAQMTPILRLLVKADRHGLLALRKAQRGDNKGFIAEVDAVDKMIPEINRRFDRAGLRDCGSNQS
jgi:hypothetical protein